MCSLFNFVFLSWTIEVFSQVGSTYPVFLSLWKRYTAGFKQLATLWSELKFILGEVLFYELMRTSPLSAEGLKAERGQSGTSATHELINRVVRKFCMFGFPRTLVLFHRGKAWSRQEKRASDIWVVYCMSWSAGDRAVPVFAYGGQACWVQSAVAGSGRTCCARRIIRAHVHHTWNILVVCGCRGYLCKFAGESWKQGREWWVVSQRSLEGQHQKTCVDTVSSHMFGQQVFPYSGGFDPNLVCYC